jgi:hypothetical protein
MRDNEKMQHPSRPLAPARATITIKIVWTNVTSNLKNAYISAFKRWSVCKMYNLLYKYNLEKLIVVKTKP